MISKAWNHKSLALVTFTVLVACFFSFSIVDYPGWAHEQLAHGEPIGFWTWDYWNSFFSKVLEAWEGEAWQVWGMVVAGAVFAFVGSSESRDSDDKNEAMLRVIARNQGMTDEEVDEIMENALTRARHAYPFWKWVYIGLIVVVCSIALITAINVWPS